MAARKSQDIDWGRILRSPAGACVVFDRDFADSNWNGDLNLEKIPFATRLKINAKAYVYGIPSLLKSPIRR